MFDCIERFYNPTRRHSTPGYLGPMNFDRQVIADPGVCTLRASCAWAPFPRLSSADCEAQERRLRIADNTIWLLKESEHIVLLSARRLSVAHA